MAAHQIATLGRGVPPARPAQGGPSVARGKGAVSPERGTRHATTVTGATVRQIDHWCSQGLLGENLTNPGNGRFRHFTDADLEILTAFRDLAALGAIGEWLAPVATALRQHRPYPGEWLVLRLDGTVDLGRDASVALVPPCWVITLTAFDQGHPRR